MKMKRVDGKARKCPDCQSNKWEFVESVPITPEELEKYLLVKYKCLNCEEEFLVEESSKKTKIVKSAKKCFDCNSEFVEKISREGADIELFMCKQCRAYMAIEQNE